VEILKRLREAVRREGPELWTIDWILHHANAAAHKALSRSFWPTSRLLKWDTRSVPLIWLRMTCGCFQK